MRSLEAFLRVPKNLLNLETAIANLCLKCRMTKAAGDCCFQVMFF